jgi:hypothetical protein
MEVLGTIQIIAFYNLYQNWWENLEKCQKWDGFFFYFLSFANFFHFSDENLECEHEPNNFFFINLAK